MTKDSRAGANVSSVVLTDEDDVFFFFFFYEVQDCAIEVGRRARSEWVLVGFCVAAMQGS